MVARYGATIVCRFDDRARRARCGFCSCAKFARCRTDLRDMQPPDFAALFFRPETYPLRDDASEGTWLTIMSY
jgi:hypothetical protein